MPTTMPTAVPAQTIVREALKKVTTLATLPEITARIISTVENPKSSATTLHKIVSHDPALVTRILKVVNSSYYGLPGQIASIERAIVLLGLNAVKNIAVASSVGQMFRGAKLCDGFTARDLWTHCVCVAVTARELAKSLNLPIADEAFLAGMIHDVGILIELQTWPEQTRAICQKVLTQGVDFCATEQETLGIDHQLLGKALAEQWKFPQACQQVAGFHHHPADAAEESQVLVNIVHIADVLCCEAAQGFNLTALHDQFDSTGLDPAAIELVRTNLPEIAKSTAGIFG